MSVGVTDFRDLIQSKRPFVDKTEFIKDIMTNSSFVNDISRPRGFGKSLILSMLRYFLDSNKAPLKTANIDLFEGLKISRNKQFCACHKNQWPILYLSFQGMNAKTFKDAKAELFAIVQAVYKEHSYLLEGRELPKEFKKKFEAVLNKTASETELKAALSELCLFVYVKTRKKLILLVDDFDTPLQASYLHNYYDDLKTLMEEVIRSLVPHGPFVHKAVVMSANGVTPHSTFQGLELLNDYSILDERFSSTFGFSIADTGFLLVQTGVGINQDELTKWYGGYNGLHNPLSILSCLANKGVTGPYWVHSPGSELVLKAIGSAGVAEMVTIHYFLMDERIGVIERRLLQDGVSLPNLGCWRLTFWSVLVHAGYLAAEFKWKEYAKWAYLVRVPNKEIRREIASWYEGKFNKGAIATFKQYGTFVDNIRNGKMEEVKRFIWTCILEKGDYYNFEEAIWKTEEYGNYLCDLFAPFKDHYDVGCHKSGRFEDRRFSLKLTPRDKSHSGVVFELEVPKDAKDFEELQDLRGKAGIALKRIKESNATSEFAKTGCKKFIGVGVGISLRGLEIDFEKFTVPPKEEYAETEYGGEW